MIKPVCDEVSIKNNYCGKCKICSSICPFEALSTDEKTGEIKLDIEKCQVCGICFSSCPVSAIEMAYYDVKSLITYVEKSMHETGSKARVALDNLHKGFY